MQGIYGSREWEVILQKRKKMQDALSGRINVYSTGCGEGKWSEIIVDIE